MKLLFLSLFFSLIGFIIAVYLVGAIVTYIDPGIMISPPTWKECLFLGFKDPMSGWDKEGHDKQWKEIEKSGNLYHFTNDGGRRIEP